jgi:hypothetical protein
MNTNNEDNFWVGSPLTVNLRKRCEWSKLGVMKKYLLALPLLLWSMVGSHAANADAATVSDNQKEFHELIGGLILQLAKNHAVSVQDFDKPTVSVNAKLGRVSYPNSKSGDTGYRYETELVPDNAGLVIKFNRPFDAQQVQKVWGWHHDSEKRKFEGVERTSDGLTIGMIGCYGSEFPRQELYELLPILKRLAKVKGQP